MLTYLLAMLASCANAVASVAQRMANRDLPREDNLRPRLILRLLRRPVWFAGILALTVGFLLQAGALAVGQLSVVEPILVCELPLTLMLASRVFRTGLHLREWASTLGMTAGLAALLYFLAPTPGSSQSVTWDTWLLGAGVNVVVVAAVVEWGRRGENAYTGVHGGGRRAAAFGVAAGAQFGLTAALMKGAMSRSAQGFVSIFTGWQLYAMVVSGLIGLFLLQSALNAGRLLAAQPGLTLSDPLVSVLWGVLAFHEHVHGGASLILALAGAVLIVVSVMVLARSPLLVPDHPALQPAGSPD
ncbi:DMT family transporter [Streptomyces sp. RB6PN25]|uniref:DMT family transporter n=1 Tax=Streptomyces humicola TaxID=2953240 RepID=A0ABT1Q534_9ACTN|nr:DMT family transporter [Streptomyces humicola]MCQ4085005.1 DMT family transporter [Streptomyces humicola]